MIILIAWPVTIVSLINGDMLIYCETFFTKRKLNVSLQGKTLPNVIYIFQVLGTEACSTCNSGRFYF